MLHLSPIMSRIAVYAGLCALLAIAITGMAFAAQDSGAIAQNFQTNSKLDLTAGSIVSLQEDSPNDVELSNTERVSQIVGIVADKPLVEFSDGNSTVSVVTSGVTEALVSDINGTIKTGDKITASPINGIGMKATEPMLIVGTAQGELGDTDTAERTINDRDGKPRTVHIGRIPVQVNVTFYTATSGAQNYIPAFLQDTANALAGKDVSPVRVLASLLLAVLALVSVSILLYSSVRSSLISIGRNPLSQTAIHKGLLEVGAIILGILLIAFVAIYLLLTIS